MKKSRITICLVLLVLLLLGVFSGYIVLQISERHIVENYYRDITIAEDIIFDNQELIDVYGAGEPISLTAGMQGYIADSVTPIGGDTKGFEYIDAYIKGVNGKALNVAISINPEVDKDVLVVESRPYPTVSESSLDNSPVRIVYPVIGISKIDSYQEILSEYKMSREKYNSRIMVAKMVSITTGFVLSVILCVGFIVLLYKSRQDNNQ